MTHEITPAPTFSKFQARPLLHSGWGVRLLYPAALTVLGTLLYSSLLDSHGFHSHEGISVYLRALEYGREFEDGHWIPQSLPNVFSGGGYAFPRFYPPLAYATAVGFTAATSNVVIGVHLSFLASVLLSGLGMYVFLASITRNRLVGLLGAMAYMTFPYRFQDIFVRGALAECWSFVWYPPILLGIWRLRESGRISWYLPIAIAALVLSHSQMALYFGLACALLAICDRPFPNRALLFRYLGAAFIGLGLAAWFWLPQKYYLNTVWAGDPFFVRADADYVSSQTVSLATLLTGVPLHNALALSVGGVGVIAQVLALLSWVRPAIEQTRRLRAFALLLLVPWWAMLLFMLWPKPLLAILPAAFGYIQFPWRLLGPMGLLSTASFALFITSWRSQRVTIAGLLVVLALVVPSGVAPYTIPEWTSAGLREQLSGPRAQAGLTSMSEYLPRTIRDLRSDYYGTIARLNQTVKQGPQASQGLSVLSFVRNGSSTEMTIDADRPGEIVLPLIYYDFYRAYTQAGNEFPVSDTEGLVALRVPSGNHVVILSEHVTPIQWLALAISLCSALIYLRVVSANPISGARSISSFQ